MQVGEAKIQQAFFVQKRLLAKEKVDFFLPLRMKRHQMFARDVEPAIPTQFSSYPLKNRSVKFTLFCLKT